MATRTLFQALFELWHPRLRAHQGLVLVEDDPGSKCPPITLNRRGIAFVLRPELLLHDCERADCHAKGLPRLFPFFSPQRQGVAALCDYLLFYEPAGDVPWTVFLLEMKSGDSSGARVQIQNGKLLAEYLLAMAELHGDATKRREIRFRGVVFTPRARRIAPVLKGSRLRFEPDERFPDLSVARLHADRPWDLDTMCAG